MSGGVSPPWVARTHMQRWLPAQRRQSSERSRQCPCKCVTANHGGLTPTALVAVAGERESNCLSRRRFTQHGGLTPPALVRAPSPTGGIATFPMHKRTFVRSGGRQPAVLREPHRQPRLRTCSRAVFTAHAVVGRRIRSGGRKPAVGWITRVHARSPAQRRQSPAYGASSLPARYRDPRGAYARHSCGGRR